MRKLKFLVILLVAVFLFPMAVLAEGEEVVAENPTATDENVVNVYLFRGEGCPHCQEAEEWFNSLTDYSSMFKIVDYETWYDEDNADLMKKVAKARGEEAEGVPYIIIGDKSWNGFADDYKEEILAQIQAVHSQAPADRYDIMKYLGTTPKKKKDTSSNDALLLILILLVTGGIGFGVYKARETAK
ncbi:MAG: glutaredoxin [Bacilli bacterium]|nr:glutaredoxin [Bacilli bacterium]